MSSPSERPHPRAGDGHPDRSPSGKEREASPARPGAGGDAGAAPGAGHVDQPTLGELKEQMLQIRAVCRQQTLALQDGRNHVSLLEAELKKDRTATHQFLADALERWHDAQRGQRIADRARQESLEKLETERERNRRLTARIVRLRLQLRAEATDVEGLRREHAAAIAEQDRQIAALTAALREAREASAVTGRQFPGPAEG